MQRLCSILHGTVAAENPNPLIHVSVLHLHVASSTLFGFSPALPSAQTKSKALNQSSNLPAAKLIQQL